MRKCTDGIVTAGRKWQRKIYEIARFVQFELYVLEDIFSKLGYYDKVLVVEDLLSKQYRV